MNLWAYFGPLLLFGDLIFIAFFLHDSWEGWGMLERILLDGGSIQSLRKNYDGPIKEAHCKK
jgi:hypothetical protein